VSYALIVAIARSPIGRFNGSLANIAATQLGAGVLDAALTRATLPASAVNEVLLGNVLSAGLGQSPARQAALAAGLPDSVATQSINKVCGSGLQAVIHGARMVSTREADFVLAGGMESMSQAPFMLKGARTGLQTGNQVLVDSLIHDGLRDATHDCHMGMLAERCARHYRFSRMQQDEYAAESFRRALRAQQENFFAAELASVATRGRKGESLLITEDDGPARADFARMPSLQPAFAEDGSITAANASQLSDGAAALLLANAESASALQSRPLARIVSWGTHACEAEWFTTAPVGAIRQALARAQWSVDSVDLWEINEAFAVVPLAAMQELGIAHDKLNVCGGAIALGHPLGASGARIVVTLVSALQRLGRQRGVAAICIGGGEALALCVERCA